MTINTPPPQQTMRTPRAYGDVVRTGANEEINADMCRIAARAGCVVGSAGCGALTCGVSGAAAAATVAAKTGCGSVGFFAFTGGAAAALVGAGPPAIFATGYWLCKSAKEAESQNNRNQGGAQVDLHIPNFKIEGTYPQQNNS